MLALVLDYGIVLAVGAEGWHVHAKHFAERFGLIVIIALGESIVAIGVGAEGVELDGGVVLAALLAIGIVCALWWAYFDVVAVIAEHRFTAATGATRCAWRATPTRCCTCRWSAASCCSPSASRRSSSTRASRSRTCRP